MWNDTSVPGQQGMVGNHHLRRVSGLLPSDVREPVNRPFVGFSFCNDVLKEICETRSADLVCKKNLMEWRMASRAIERYETNHKEMAQRFPAAHGSHSPCLFPVGGYFLLDCEGRLDKRGRGDGVRQPRRHGRRIHR